MTDQPFEIVKSPEFITLAAFGRSKVSVPSPDTVKRRLMKMFENERVSLRAVLTVLQISPSVGFALDFYISNPCSCAYFTRTSPGKFPFFFRVLEDLQIASKVLAVTCDNASNIDTMAAELSLLLEDKGSHEKEE